MNDTTIMSPARARATIYEAWSYDPVATIDFIRGHFGCDDADVDDEGYVTIYNTPGATNLLDSHHVTLAEKGVGQAGWELADQPVDPSALRLEIIIHDLGNAAFYEDDRWAPGHQLSRTLGRLAGAYGMAGFLDLREHPITLLDDDGNTIGRAAFVDTDPGGN